MIKIILTFCLYSIITNIFARELTCAITDGYPPFQYAQEKKIKGLDKDAADLFNKYNKNKIKLRVMNWRDAYGSLHFSSKIDCFWGMEVTKSRRSRFKFSDPIYKRYSALFVLEESKYSDLSSLNGKIIGEDRDSFINNQLLDKKTKIRFAKVDSKDNSFLQLKNKRFYASIAPKRVGYYLSKKFNIKTKIIMEDDKGVNIAIAVKKDDVLAMINEGLKNIPKAELENIFKLK